MFPSSIRPVAAVRSLALLTLAVLTATAPLHASGVRLREARASGTGWVVREGSWTPTDAGVVLPLHAGEVVSSYTVPVGGAGFHAIEDSFLRREPDSSGTIALQVSVHRLNVSDDLAHEDVVVAHVAPGELFDFDAFLGYLAAGDRVELSVRGEEGTPRGMASLDFALAQVPSIPLVAFPADRDRWVEVDRVAMHSAIVRPGVGNIPPTGSIRLSGEGRETLLAFAVPQSGYYALHDATISAVDAPARVRIHTGGSSEPRRQIDLEPSAVQQSLDTEIGYVARGDVICIAFSGVRKGSVEFSGSIVEWAPRRAPLRVHRGSDGLLDVVEPIAPRTRVDVPASRWISVPAPGEGRDATESIRGALARAAAVSRNTGVGYAGIRLERGKVYPIASNQKGGAIFALENAEDLLFDGNGATVRIAAAEFARRDFELFTVRGGRDIVFHDMIVEATTVPFTTGTILDVTPRGESTQTVTFRLDTGALDPLADISPDGKNNGYAYDAAVPGRLAPGTWTHYPGAGSPSIQATESPGVFTHRVTRTNDSIERGGRWLIKNKRAGVVYLTTRGGAENITLSAIDGHASGGGTLRFWQTSGVNILDCSFEPQGTQWISSGADGVHGRGREGVWIENTLFRGICEDIMNTYGQNMIVVDDGDPEDAVVTIRMFTRSSESFDDGAMPRPTRESLDVGDQLMFFDPNTGRVLGYAGIRGVDGDRVTLANPVAGIDPWSEGDGKRATMVYNTRVAGRFFVRDSRFMDSMRFGIYVKARGGVIFGSQFEGLSAPAVFATNEPEWPEGPPSTHLWVQGCVFSQNNFGYMPRHRDFMVVDPADISVYTRRLRMASEQDSYTAHLAQDQFANSHLRFVGNVFHDWRGMGISVRNARNVRIEGNFFLPPVDDPVMQTVLNQDPELRQEGRGGYAAIHVASTDGVRIRGNRFLGLADRGAPLAIGNHVTGLADENNAAFESSMASAMISLSFDSWFGDSSSEAAGFGSSVDRIHLGSATHQLGRLGAGLRFSGGAPAVLEASPDLRTRESEACAIAVWAQPGVLSGADQILAKVEGRTRTIVLGLSQGRWFARLESEQVGARLDLGPAAAGRWQHLAVTVDAPAGRIRGFVDGLEQTTAKSEHGAARKKTRPGIELGRGYFGSLDEFRVYAHGLAPMELGALALRADRITSDQPADPFP